MKLFDGFREVKALPPMATRLPDVPGYWLDHPAELDALIAAAKAEGKWCLDLPYPERGYLFFPWTRCEVQAYVAKMMREKFSDPHELPQGLS